jgi:predicted anti-sigma-YlaC factor YlaD
VHGNRSPSFPDLEYVGCDQYREALSADLDGEPADCADIGPAELRGHLDGCAGCRVWYAAITRVTRLARLAPAEPIPDLAPAVLAAVRPTRSVRQRLVAAARAALVVVAFVQALLAWPGALTGRDGMVTGHVAHEVGAWNLALAVAFLAAATRPRTAEALVAPVGVFVAVLAVSAVSDAVAGDLTGSRLAAHLLVAAGLGLLVAMARAYPPLPAVPPADGSVPRSRLSGPRPAGPVAVPAPAEQVRPASVRAGSAA